MISKDTGSLVAERTLRVLSLFIDHKELTLLEISDLLQISKTATYRIVSTLTNMGFLIKDKSRHYVLGSILIQLAEMVQPNLRKVALPVMTKLSLKTQESIYLSVSHKIMYHVYIERVESPHPFKWSLDLGEPMLSHAGTVGKAHLAFRDTKELEEIFANINLILYTPNTIIDKKELYGELMKIRKQGYAFSKSEHYEGNVGISVPIMSKIRNERPAILTIIIPEHRFEEGKLPELILEMKSAAAEIHSLL